MEKACERGRTPSACSGVASLFTGTCAPVQPQPAPDFRRLEEPDPRQRQWEEEDRRQSAGQVGQRRNAEYPETELPKEGKTGKKKGKQKNYQKEKRRFRGGQIVACLILLVLAAGCITGTVLVTRRLANPERAAQHFLDAVLAGDVDTAYGMLDFTDVDEETQAVLTEEVFAQLLPSQEELDQGLTGQVEALTQELSDCITGSPELLLEAAELSRLLDKFLRTLPQKERCVFLRRYWYCDSISDIAARCHMASGTVKSSLHRTRGKLKRYLQEEGIFV